MNKHFIIRELRLLTNDINIPVIDKVIEDVVGIRKFAMKLAASKSPLRVMSMLQRQHPAHWTNLCALFEPSLREARHEISEIYSDYLSIKKNPAVNPIVVQYTGILYTTAVVKLQAAITKDQANLSKALKIATDAIDRLDDYIDDGYYMATAKHRLEMAAEEEAERIVNGKRYQSISDEGDDEIPHRAGDTLRDLVYDPNPGSFTPITEGSRLESLDSALERIGFYDETNSQSVPKYPMEDIVEPVDNAPTKTGVRAITPNGPSLEALVSAHNHQDSGVSRTTEDVVEDDGNNSSLPPDQVSGGTSDVFSDGDDLVFNSEISLTEMEKFFTKLNTELKNLVYGDDVLLHIMPASPGKNICELYIVVDGDCEYDLVSEDLLRIKNKYTLTLSNYLGVDPVYISTRISIVRSFDDVVPYYTDDLKRILQLYFSGDDLWDITFKSENLALVELRVLMHKNELDLSELKYLRTNTNTPILLYPNPDIIAEYVNAVNDKYETAFEIHSDIPSELKLDVSDTELIDIAAHILNMLSAEYLEKDYKRWCECDESETALKTSLTVMTDKRLSAEIVFKEILNGEAEIRDYIEFYNISHPFFQLDWILRSIDPGVSIEYHFDTETIYPTTIVDDQSV